MKIEETTDETFDVDVLQYPNKPVVVMFHAAWAGPSRLMRSVFEDVAYDLNGKALFKRLDVENNAVSAHRYHIKGLPTIVVFDKGEVKLMKLGAGDRAQVLEWLAEAGLTPR